MLIYFRIVVYYFFSLCNWYILLFLKIALGWDQKHHHFPIKINRTVFIFNSFQLEAGLSGVDLGYKENDLSWALFHLNLMATLWVCITIITIIVITIIGISIIITIITLIFITIRR